MRAFWLFLALCFSAQALEITLEFLESKPKGLARDFYIWQFLSAESTTLKEATKAYGLIHRKTSKLDKLMEAKGKVSQLPRNLYCQRLGFEALKKQDIACIKAGLSLSSIPSMQKKNVSFLLKTFENDASMKKKIQILSSPNILTGMLQSNAEIFSSIYYSLSEKQKINILNQSIKASALQKLADENNKRFNNMLQYILTRQENDFEKFKTSLLGANITKADSYTLLLLGINELLHNKQTNALRYFKLASKSGNAMSVNRALFWQHYISGEQEPLIQLANSTNVDLYTIYAVQKLGTEPKYSVVSNLGNLSSKEPDFDIKDPFQWQEIQESISKDKRNLKKITKHFNFSSTAAHLAYVLTHADNFTTHYFITPFSEKLIWKSDHQRAFTYAIAKQESTLLPALVSTSYALGMMQIMPFNVEPFAKALKKSNITLESMFDPIIALEFGTYYLDHLTKDFKNPLFVSYAYNGGPGALKRNLAKKKLFLKKRKYEPWISMELWPIRESRDYGFRVLANYVVYQKSFGNEINLEKLLKETLVN